MAKFVRQEKMKKLLQQIRLSLFPSTSRKKAITIAREQCASKSGTFYTFSRKPKNVYIYNMPVEPCWFVFSPWNDGKDGTMLRSSRLILVSKLSGKVLYDGSAYDEG